MYQHDIYLSTTFGYLARHREAKTTVQYPAEVLDDEDITDTHSYIRPDTLSWLRGSNYCADLYRMLEHITGDMRTKVPSSSDQAPGSAVTALLARAPVISTSEYLSAVQSLSDALPPRFKSAKPMTGDPKQDRVGFLGASSPALLSCYTFQADFSFSTQLYHHDTYDQTDPSEQPEEQSAPSMCDRGRAPRRPVGYAPRLYQRVKYDDGGLNAACPSRSDSSYTTWRVSATCSAPRSDLR